MKPLKKHSGFRSIPHGQVVARLMTIPLDERTKKEFYELFRSWSDSSGPQWACDRTEQLRICVMQTAAKGRISHKPEWFATTKSGTLKGVPGRLTRLAMTSRKDLRAVLMLLNLRTVWKRTVLPKEDIDAIAEAVQASPVVRGDGTPGVRLLRKMEAIWYNNVPAFYSMHGTRRVPRSSCARCIPVTQVLPGKRSHAQRFLMDCLDLRSAQYHRTPEPIRQALGGYLIPEGFTPSALDAVFSAKHMYAKRGRWELTPKQAKTKLNALYGQSESGISRAEKFAGKVNWTHEPGLKTRFFADPNTVLQRACEPVKDALFRVLKEMPWDCTHHQRKADGVIVGAMQKGVTVHSVDMSKATDNFPWEYQKRILRLALNTNDWYTSQCMELFVDLVERGVWQLSHGRTLKRVRWTKGQPLGLGPSFPLFALTHGLVLLTLNEGRWDQDFFVLGDDVVILRDDLAIKYRKWLQTVGVPVSEQKSFASNRFGQFAGKNYTPSGSFWIPKWDAINQDNVLDACAWWYPGLSQAFPRDRELIDRILSIPEPYGRGWNPKGFSLDERFPQELANTIVEQFDARLGRPKPTSVAVRQVTLDEAVRLTPGLSEYSQYQACPLILEEWRAVSRPTRSTTVVVPPQAYAPDTEVPGFPAIRLRKRFDPYSKGLLKSWKQHFRAMTTHA